MDRNLVVTLLLSLAFGSPQVSVAECDFQPLACGQTVTATWDGSCGTFQGSPEDPAGLHRYFDLEDVAGRSVTVELSSAAVEAMVLYVDRDYYVPVSKKIVRRPETNVQIEFVMKADADYYVNAVGHHVLERGRPAEFTVTATCEAARPGTGDGPEHSRAPRSPVGLTAEAVSQTSVQLVWRAGSPNTTGFHVESRLEGEGEFVRVASVGGDEDQVLVDGLEPGRLYVFRVVASNSAGLSPASEQVAVVTEEDPSVCLPDEATICLQEGRFRVRAAWRSANGSTGAARPKALTDEGAYFWFFAPETVEAFVKVVNGCAVNDRVWLFAGGLTDVQVDLAVTDSWTGRSVAVFNPAGRLFASSRDLRAFPCP